MVFELVGVYLISSCGCSLLYKNTNEVGTQTRFDGRTCTITVPFVMYYERVIVFYTLFTSMSKCEHWLEHQTLVECKD